MAKCWVKQCLVSDRSRRVFPDRMGCLENTAGSFCGVKDSTL